MPPPLIAASRIYAQCRAELALMVSLRTSEGSTTPLKSVVAGGLAEESGSAPYAQEAMTPMGAKSRRFPCPSCSRRRLPISIRSFHKPGFYSTVTRFPLRYSVT